MVLLIYLLLQPEDADVHGQHLLVVPVCGDGHVDDDEECDDYNLVEGDGCGSNCTVENGWYCEVTRGIPPKSRCLGRDEDVCGEANCPLSSSYSCPPCEPLRGRCIWYRGRNYCRCLAGYVDEENRNDRLTREMLETREQVCIDHDECSSHVDSCKNDSEIGWCANTIGSFTCECAVGYVGEALYSQGASACADQNECDEFKSFSITGGFLHECLSLFCQILCAPLIHLCPPVVCIARQELA